MEGVPEPEWRLREGREVQLHAVEVEGPINIPDLMGSAQLRFAAHLQRLIFIERCHEDTSVRACGMWGLGLDRCRYEILLVNRSSYSMLP